MGRCPAHGDGIAFWALGEMVRERAGLLETDDEETTRSRIAAMVREWVPDESEQRWLEPALLALLGIETTLAAPELLFGAWRTFFERIATRGTVVLVFEDLHVADAGLLSFIDHLVEWSRVLPFFVLTLSRPELMERRPDWGAGKRSFASIYLEPLPEPEMRELLAGLVRGCPRPPRPPSCGGPMGCRCTRWRPSACSSMGASSWRPTAPSGRSATCWTWRSRRH